ncbi:MAG: HAMP domain-containing histidine kinase, partial [Gammaproteobacteria bacterium]|nr:HAMP domain-containing histidine kinase [Gammaproteobacteria bacterium]
MVEEILESQRIGSGPGALQLTPTDLGELVAQVIEAQGDQPPGVRVVGPLRGFVLRVDSKRIAIAVRNVVQNAIKHSSTQYRAVEVSVSKRAGEFSIQVRDFGEGISDSEQSLIFEPFYRVDKSRQRDAGGYGLGLSLCKKIVEAHGGTIEVQSELGVGSTFTMTLPGRYEAQSNT